MPEISKDSASTDNNKRLFRNVHSLLKNVAKTPLLGISEDTFRTKLQEWLVAEQASMQAARLSHVRLQNFINSLAEPTVSFTGEYIDDIILELTKL